MSQHQNENVKHRERIAIVGSGISGLTCAYLLSPHHDVTIFEAEDTLGGHTNTEEITLGKTTYPVNTGFIVFNDWTYPNFIKLITELEIPFEDSNMSFSVQAEDSHLEYNGTSLNTLFCQRKNLFSPRFWQMVKDILRFNQQALKDLNDNSISDNITLEEYLNQKGYQRYFVEYYIVPMAAAIWSCPETVIYKFPLKFFIKFLANHGLLSVKNRPTWKVLTGGSETYIRAIQKNFQGQIRLNCPVESVERLDACVRLNSKHGDEKFDHVIFSCHSDQALNCLKAPTETEKQVLSALKYQSNDVVLHTDTQLLPKNKKAWASWNYYIPADRSSESRQAGVSVTYNMNILQNFKNASETFCVTLNRHQDINPKKIIKRFDYAHPIYSQAAVDAQQQFDLISNQQRTHYCGAYWFNGFHEDGVNSALRVIKHWGIQW